MKLNQKELIRGLFGFLNFRNMVRVSMWAIPSRRNRTFFLFEGREYTYGEVYRQSERYADYFLALRRKQVQSGRLGPEERLSIGIYTDNIPEFLFASFGAGLSNSVLFAVNTGFRGETLAKVINQANVSLLIINESTVDEVERIVPDITVLGRDDILFAGGQDEAQGYRVLEEAIEGTNTTHVLDWLVPIDNFSPVIVIYTSGMTGMPKGVPCTHIKLVGAGAKVRFDTGLRKTDRGYISMPLFHSNAWYIGILPQLVAGGSFVLKRKFSARAFEEDMLEHGVTFLNYVGQPLHYILDALEKKYGGPEGIEKALANDPRNKFRIAYGNGATALDRKKLMKCLNMDHIYEIYGSTEAVITTANKPGDPVESVGEAPGNVKILDPFGKECPPGIVDGKGQLADYDQAVGEICAEVGSDNLRFEGYYGNQNATSQKFRDGIYHSGDLGHIRLAGNKRYLFFNGRTDDWIRKDGENFSAEDVLRYACELPGVDIAIAYGAPCEVSDEKVMVTLQLVSGCALNPDEAFNWFMKQQKDGGMDPKWMPDYIRVIESFPVTETQKIIIRPFKREHFNIEASPGMEVWYRIKGDTTYSRLTPEKYGEIKESFIRNGRETLLSQG
jgi:fatty-acyl-CoA synthase